MGNYTQAEPLYKQAMEIDRKALGDDHPSFANSLNNLAGIYSAMGNYTQAEPLYKQATWSRPSGFCHQSEQPGGDLLFNGQLHPGRATL